MRKTSIAMILLMLAGIVFGSVNIYAYEYTGGTKPASSGSVTVSWDPDGAWNEDKEFANDLSIFTVNSPAIGGTYTVGQEISLSVTPNKYFNYVLPGGVNSNLADNFVMTILKGDSIVKSFEVNYRGSDVGDTYTDSFTPTEAGTYKINIFFRGLYSKGSNYGNYYIQVEKAPGAEIGSTEKVSGQSYKVLTDSTVAFTKAANKASVSVPNTVKINSKTYKVTQIAKAAFKGSKIKTVTINKNISKIAAYAFKGSKVTKIILKTKKLTKKTVKNSLKGSKVKTVQVKVNKSTLKKYRTIFVKKVVGKTVAVK